MITSVPVLLGLMQPGKTLTRHTIAIGQMLMSAVVYSFDWWTNRNTFSRVWFACNPGILSRLAGFDFGFSGSLCGSHLRRDFLAAIRVMEVAHARFGGSLNTRAGSF